MNYLWETAPFCGSAPCYVHGMAWGYAEHHVRGCLASQSLAGQHHLLTHEVRELQATFGAALDPAIQEVHDALTLWYEQLPFRTKLWVEMHILIGKVRTRLTPPA